MSGARVSLLFVAASVVASASCSTAGSTWMSESTVPDDGPLDPGSVRVPRERPSSNPSADPARFESRVIGSEAERPEWALGGHRDEPLRGKVLGIFRNTYYDFPSEADFFGENVMLHDAKCGDVASVPRAFYDAVCVQGSGILSSGRTVSFAKRDCECAEMCPRTGEKICFEALDPSKFPWGRGALGLPITPLITVAVDDAVIPMGTAIYIPEFEGLPVDAAGKARHDGCFIAQDRGSHVKGLHVDVFTGTTETTALFNRLVPTNHGVTVVLDSPKCARANVTAGNVN